MKRRSLLASAASFAALSLAAAGLTACSNENEGTSGSDTTIEFWYAMAGRNGEAVIELVDRYNAQNDNGYTVEAVYQGNYNDTLTKLKASAQSGSLPDAIQVNELSTRFMFDSGLAIPAGQLAEDSDFDFGDLNQRILDYYTIEGVVQSMPFNVSAPLFYYNKDAFAAAGLDPDSPPQTLSEIREAAEALTGGLSEYGFVSSIDGYFIEQYLAVADEPYCDASNGRAGLATKVEWENPVTEDIISWWADMVNDGFATNVGRNNNNASAAFQSGTAAMITFTSANLRDIIDGADFEVGIAPFPKPHEDNSGGPILGGGSLWAVETGDEDKANAVFDFLAFMLSPESQATWSSRTGYVAVNDNALTLPEYTEVLDEYPDLGLAGDQLAATPKSDNTSGCLMGVMPQARDRMNDAIEAALLQVKTPKDALETSASGLTSAINQYNESVS